ncbi:MAG: hypothetical protein KF736_06395 [Acidobacteria bacterium]|nr:hypothetical protein [Acidobacteriota bacterium]MCW5949098.1 hypothetical protein [Pyrinomonadaceae bacterium]
MIHFLYLIGFALFVSVVFGAIAAGSTEEKVKTGVKSFAQFVLVSLVLAWLLYFIPW